MVETGVEHRVHELERDMARVMAQISGLEVTNKHLASAVDRLNSTMEQLVRTMERSKGAVAFLVAIGASIGGLTHYLIDFVVSNAKIH